MAIILPYGRCVEMSWTLFVSHYSAHVNINKVLYAIFHARCNR